MKRLAVLLCCLLTLAAAHGESVPVSDAGSLAVGDFFKGASFRNLALSPDGKFVLAIEQPDTQHQYISVVDLVQETSTPVVTAGDPREYFRGVMWVSNDTFIFYDNIGKDVSKFVAAKLSFNGGKPGAKLTVWPGSYWIVDRLVRQGSYVLLANREDSELHLYRADVNAGPEGIAKQKPLYSLDSDVDDVVTDHDGNPIAMQLSHADGVRHYLRYIHSPKGDTWKEFKKIDDAKTVFSIELVAPDGHDLYVFSNIGRDNIGYFEYDPDTDKFVKTLYANDQADVAGYSYDANTDSFIYVRWYEGTDPHYEILDKRALSYESSLRDAFPGKQVVPSYISADGQELLVFVYSDTDAGTYYAFDVAKRRAELLGPEYPWLDPAIMAPVKPGSLKTKDGFTVTYLLSLPKTGHGPYPMVVVPHGGPIGVFNVNSFDAETQLITSRGYAVLKINYRGSGGNGKAFEDAGKHQWGRKIEDDIEEVVHNVIQSAPVDANRICIYGASYGGYSALMSVIRDPALYKCAASYAGVTDLPLLYDTTDVQFDQQVRDEMADIIGDPTKDADQLRAMSPVYLADKIKRPVFLAQGGEDTRVDAEQAYRLKLVMETLNKPLEFRFYPNEIHGFKYTEDETDFYLRLLDFFSRNIASDRPVAPAVQ